MALCDAFAGLEEGVNRYALLLLVKRVGKHAGFSPRMIALLDYYMAFTRDVDWEEGARPIVYQSLSRTALDLGVSERQVQKLEARLFEAGAICWNDSGNHRRYGQRDPGTGRILYAFGVELTPLAALRGALEQKLHDKQLHDEAWLAAKREISWLRRQVRGLLIEAQQRGADTETFGRHYDEIAVQLRTHIDLAAMRSLLERHRSLHSDFLASLGEEGGHAEQPTQRHALPQETPIGSCRSEQTFVYYKPTTQELNLTCSRNDDGLQESVAGPPAATSLIERSGLAHVSLGMALGAASGRLRVLLPPESGWPDLVEGAYRLRPKLGISQASWGKACATLGRSGAALCLLVTDRATERPENAVRRPAAYFRGMVRRAEQGELRLHASLFGLSERGAGARLRGCIASPDPGGCRVATARQSD